MERKKIIWPALALSVILVIFCSAFFLNYQQNLSTADELEKTLREEKNKNEALEEKVDELKEDLQKLEKEYNSVIDNPEGEESGENGNSNDPPADNPPADNPPANGGQEEDEQEDEANTGGSDSVSENNPGGSGPVAYLTFDDGPSSNTVKILDTLQRKGIKGTFFVTGNNTIGNNDIYRRIVNDGHTLANHTYTHNFNSLYKSPDAFMKDFLRMEDFLYEITGVKTDIMRFPGGSSSSMAQQVSGYNIIVDDLIRMVKESGYDYVDWNVSSGDGTANLTSAEIVNNVLEGADRVDGDLVVLFHDSKSRTTTAEAIPEVIRELDRRGYEFEQLTPGATNVRHR